MPFDQILEMPDLGHATAARTGADVPWVLAQLRPNQATRAEANLARQGYGTFLPLTEVTRRRGNRLVAQRVPLFPGYLFVALEPTQPWRPICGTYGVLRLVMRVAKTPQPVPHEVMADLIARADADGVLVPGTNLATGDNVRITAGAMTGFVARVEAVQGATRIGVLLEMMGQAVRATLPPAHLLRLAG